MSGLADIRAPAGAFPAVDSPRAPASLKAVRIVLVDRETAFTRVLAHRALGLRWQCTVLDSPPGLEELAALEPEAVLVDAGIVAGGLWGLLSDSIAAMPGVAVIVTSAQSAVADRVRALRLGADDWITKPLHPDEVVARIEAVVRRRREFTTQVLPGAVVAGELEIRPDRFQAYIDGQSAGLTRREYELLELLAQADGRVLEREEIYERVWGYTMVRGDRSVDVFIGKIRGKLALLSPTWRYVHTHVGVGYRFGAEPAKA